MQETPQQRAERIEPMLAAAGFHMLPADTPERVAETQRLTPLKVRYFIDNGKPRYLVQRPGELSLRLRRQRKELPAV